VSTRCQRISDTLQDHHEDNYPVTDENRIQCGIAMSLEAEDANDQDKETYQCTSAQSVESHERDGTREE